MFTPQEVARFRANSPIAFVIVLDRLQRRLMEFGYEASVAGMKPEDKPFLKQLMDDIDAQKARGRVGRLTMIRELLDEMEAAHKRFQTRTDDVIYQGAYALVLPLIVELRSKAGKEKYGEMETLITAFALYSMLPKETMLPDTKEAMGHIATFLNCFESYFLGSFSQNPPRE